MKRNALECLQQFDGCCFQMSNYFSKKTFIQCRYKDYSEKKHIDKDGNVDCPKLENHCEKCLLEDKER